MTSRPRPSDVSASDLLPTAEAVALAKGFAARACAARAVECAWPDMALAVNWIEAIPLVAHAVLVALCPEVSPSRLANCLGQTPDVIAKLGGLARRRCMWTPDLIAAIAQDVRAA